LDGWEQQADQNRDDRDYDQQLDEGKPSTLTESIHDALADGKEMDISPLFAIPVHTEPRGAGSRGSANSRIRQYGQRSQ
jgi:hypothetical protein